MSARSIPAILILTCFVRFSAEARAQTDAAQPAEAATKELSPAEKLEILEQALNQVDQIHADQFKDNPYPSAKDCGECHPQHFDEWAVSPHAYAQISPVFNAMSNKLNELTSGTNGDFCIRCHTPVGMALNEPINASNFDRNATSREGVTCVVCHRINQPWGKGSGRQALVAGSMTTSVVGPKGSEFFDKVLKDPVAYGVMKSDRGISIKGTLPHPGPQRFFQMTTSAFCGTCHDVFAPNGFRLEDAFSEYKVSPAAREGISCQDCHMGKTPGKNEGYDESPGAVLFGGRPTPERKHTNHMMAGPDYSIVHPGLFPHHRRAICEKGETPSKNALATMEEWLLFEHQAGWGTDQFEDSVTDSTEFPDAWSENSRRVYARKIIDEQEVQLRKYDKQRYQVLRAGYHLGNIEVQQANFSGLRFRAPVSNITTGHGVPTGFDAERVVYLRTRVWNGNGRLVFQSGDLDPNGDLRDSHSVYVHNGEVPLDRQLFTLQTRFITRNVRGGEREQVLAVPYSLDPLPYVRPETRPFTVLGRPVAARKHKQNIEPGGRRWAEYAVPATRLRGPGPYRIRVQLIAGMVPINLVHEISSVGFDYHMSAREVADRVVDGHMILYDESSIVNAK